jgi:AsmA family protein
MASEAPMAGRAPEPRPKRTWRGSLTWPVRVLLGILAAIFLAWLVLYITKGRFLKDTFVDIASERTGRPVKVGGDFNLFLNPFHIQFLAEKIAVANPPWARDDQLFEADKVELQVNIWKLIFGGGMRFRYLDIVRGDIALETNTKGQNTWTFKKSEGEPLEMPRIRRAAIVGTTLAYVNPLSKFEVKLKIGDVAAQRTQIQGPLTGRRSRVRSPCRARASRRTCPSRSAASCRRPMKRSPADATSSSCMSTSPTATST